MIYMVTPLISRYIPSTKVEDQYEYISMPELW